MDAKPLAEALLTATAAQDAAASRVIAYREALTARYRTLYEQEGIRATIELPGLGKARWDTPEATPIITDPTRFMRWAGDACDVRITVRPHIAELIEAFLASRDLPWKREDVLRDTDRDAILAKLTPTDDGAAVTADGELVEGVSFRAQAPRLVVTVEPDCKRDAKTAARAAVEAELDG